MRLVYFAGSKSCATASQSGSHEGHVATPIEVRTCSANSMPKAGGTETENLTSITKY